MKPEAAIPELPCGYPRQRESGLGEIFIPQALGAFLEGQNLQLGSKCMTTRGQWCPVMVCLLAWQRVQSAEEGRRPCFPRHLQRSLLPGAFLETLLQFSGYLPFTHIGCSRIS